MNLCTRRRFFSLAAGAVAWPAAAGPGVPAGGPARAGDMGARAATLVDLTRCIGCRACESACRTRRGLPPLPPAGIGFGPGEGRLSFTSWTFIDNGYRAGADGRAAGALPVKKQCMHCLDPACVSACPVAALHQTERGAVVYRAERCIGCRYCMIACPFGVPRYEWMEGLTPRVGKCDYCDDRQAAGQAPACVAACPTGALKHGRRAGILREAHARLDASSRRYQTIYGDKVVGGTSWIYVSDVPMERFGFRTDLPDTPLPSLTWKALAKIPAVVLTLGLVLSAAYRLRRWRHGAAAGHGPGPGAAAPPASAGGVPC